MIDKQYHVPVMGSEVIEYLITEKRGIYIDGTAGTGGHTELIVKSLSADGKIIAADLDDRMLSEARRRHKEVNVDITFVNYGYHQIAERLSDEDKPVDGFLLDLGICSLQIDQPAGFAFKSDNPLDMRFSSDNELTAEDIINNYPAGELRQIFRKYGELKQAGSLAQRIVKAREENRISTTEQLKAVIQPLFKAERLNKSLAKVGQALRIAVNNELENLKNGLTSLTRILKSGGRIVVISYHSLEDRIVKNFIRNNSRDSGYPPELEEVLSRREFNLESLTRKAITPSEEEIKSNPRARSAKLRAAVKV